MTLEKKIPQPLLPGLARETFRSRVRRYLLVREVREHLICWGTFQVSFFLSFFKLFFFSFFKFCQLLVSEFLSGIESAEILARVVDVRA